jgi:drug/metabolite transporter (DMT)-like permease
MRPSTAGAMWMVLASFLFAWMGLGVKVAARALTVGEIVFWRNALTMLAMVIILRKDAGEMAGHNRPLLVARGVVGVASMYAYFQGIALLPLGDAVLLTYTSPMWVAALSPWVLGERPARAQWWALCLGLAGVALVVPPTGAASVGAAWSLTGAVLAATAYVLLRRLTRTDRGSVVLLWFAAIATAASSPAVADSEATWTPPVAGAVLAVGGLGVVSQLAMTRAFSLGNAATIAVYSYTTPVFAYAFGLVWLGEVPTPRAMAGASIVLVAGAISWWLDQRPPVTTPPT